MIRLKAGGGRMRVFVLCCALEFAAGAILAQTMVESVVILGGTGAGTVATGKGMGGAVGGVVGKITSTLAGAGTNAPAKTTSPRGVRPGSTAAVVEIAPPASPSPDLPKPSRAELEGVQAGMQREQLVAKVGRPEFSISMVAGGHVQETLLYTTKEGVSAKVLVIEGKVSSVEWPQVK